MINGAHLLSGVIYDSISVVNMILKFKNGYPCQWIIKDSRTCHILFYFDFSSQFENQPGSFFVKCNQSGRGYYESHSYYCKSKGKWKYKNVSDTLTKKLEIVFYRTDKGEKDLGITQESGYNLNIEDEFVLELRPRSYIVYRTNNPYVLVTPIVENKIKLASKTLFPVNDSKIYIKCTPSSMGLNCQQVQKDVAEKEIIDLRKLE
jgi:hypothetical protein